MGGNAGNLVGNAGNAGNVGNEAGMRRLWVRMRGIELI